MGLEAPPILDNGKPVSGRVSTTFTPNTTDPTYRLMTWDATRIRHYPPVDPASPANTLVVRDGFLGAPRTIPRDEWQFGRMNDGQVIPDISAIYLTGGVQPGHFYELSYEAKDAVVAGIGFGRCATSHPRSNSRARGFRRAMPMPMALHRMDVFYGSFCTRGLMPTRRTGGPLMV